MTMPRYPLPRALGPVWLLGAAAALLLFASAAQARPAPESFSGLVKDLLPAVVNISTTQTVEGAPQIAPPFMEGSPLEDFFREFFGENMPESMPRQVSALGSGFIIDADGYVVTNNHVVAKAEEIRVILADERTFEAELVGTDEATDLALLKVDAGEPLPFVRWGRSDETEVGDWVVAIGNPFGLGGSVTAGVLSARARDIRAGPYDDFLQTDAAINRGNSGGPLFNAEGAVIGVNTVILSPTGGNIGIGFAVPSSTARPVVEQLREHGAVRRGWIGVKIQSVSEDIAEAVGLDAARGALVAEVVDGGPADRAGMRPGDIILSFAGREVDEVRDLPRIVANTELGSTVEIGVWRKGREMALTATVAEREPRAARRAPGAMPESEEPTAATLGMKLAPLDETTRGRLGLGEDVEGVVVTAVHPQGPAAARGIRPGDVIVEVNQEAVSRPRDVVEKLAEAKRAERSVALLRINRAGDYRYVAFPA